jgi:hypothetical protein
MPTVAAIIAALTLTQTTTDPLPMDTDHLVSRGGEAKVVLVLDESCSMNQDNLNYNCPIVPYEVDTKQDQLKAALSGCIGNDGVFDLFAGDVEFAIFGFSGGFGTRLIQDFTNDAALLNSRVVGPQNDDCNAGSGGIKACGGTPMTQGINVAATHMKTTFDVPFGGQAQDDDRICNRYHLVALGDGFPNSGGTQTFDQRCDGTTQQATEFDPVPGTTYLGGGDVMCQIPEDQVVNTFTIGFGDANSFDENLLIDMAQGDGFYAYAADVVELTEAFGEILQTIVARDAVNFGPGSVSNDGLFDGNDAYVSSFKPAIEGAWPGNLKRACVLPKRNADNTYDTAENRCLFRGNLADGGKTLLNNLDAQDFFDAGSPLGNATIGGAASLIYNGRFGGGAAPNRVFAENAGEVPSDVWKRRNIHTWLPGTDQYRRVTPDEIKAADVGLGDCERAKTMALIHGYDPGDSFLCDALVPTAYSAWPMGAVVNGGTALMRYSDDCSTGTCVVAVGGNNATIHFFDSQSGEELLGLVPGDLWQQNPVSDRALSALLRQPSLDYRRLPTIDGGSILYHDDVDQDRVIDGTESALFITGLGHGGSAYYLFDVSDPINTAITPDAAPSSAGNPVYSVARTVGNWTEDLRSTVAAPIINIGKFDSAGQVQPFVAFTSGADWEAARPEHDYAGFEGEYVRSPTEEVDKACTDVLDPAAAPLFCNPPTPIFTFSYEVATSGSTSTVTPASPYTAVYDVILNFEPRVSAVTGATFDFIDLEPNDFIAIRDTKGNVLTKITEANNGFDVKIPFYTTERTIGGSARFLLEFSTDGVTQLGNARGARLNSIQVTEEPTRQPDGHKPFLAVLDVEALQDPARAFKTEYDPGPELLFVTSDCSGTGVDASRCIDRTSDPALEDLLCPISAQPTAYTEGGVVRAFYFGDICGQLWKVYTPDSGNTWEAIKLLQLNEKLDPSALSPGSIVSKNVRRIERPVDVFVTGCQGGRSIGVTFGTGNLSRPAAKDDLDGATAATAEYAGFDVIGTVFDNSYDKTTLPNPLRLEEGSTTRTEIDATLAGSVTRLVADNTCNGECLTDVTNADRADITTADFRGYFFRLQEDERMLRDAITVEGVTFYKTFRPIDEATACQAATGRDTAYAVNNCTAEPAAANSQSTSGPANTGNAFQDARIAAHNDDEGSIGGNFLVITSKDDLIVSAGIATDSNNGGRADLLQSRSRGLRMLYWYVPETL